jgi:protein-S-isoprenylcysteine O-methyltransferase Ste14
MFKKGILWGLVVVWLLLAGMQLRAFVEQRDLLAGMLALESSLIAWFLLRRREAQQEAPWWQRGVAWASVFLPLLFRSETASWVGELVAGAGLVLILWALFALGNSFGIAPADRGLISHGPYRYVRHPMYAGALLNGAGVLVSAFTIWNGLIWIMVFAAAGLRIRWEEGLLFGYQTYQTQVRWRLWPGVW